MNSPIKYYGGKTYMTEILKSYFPKNYDIYIEGFGGGASMLLSKKRDEIEIYNDLEKNVYSLFKCISDKKLCNELENKMSLTYYSQDIRKEFKDNLLNSNLSTLDRAYYFLYVNRSSFNGVGGFSVNPCIRRHMAKCISDYLSCIESLPEIHERLFGVIIENRDIFDLIDKYDSENVFFYLDPPYVQSERKSNQKYLCEFTDEMHEQFVNRLCSIKGKALISGYDNPIYNILENNGFTKINFESPNAKSDAIETIWFNYAVDESNSNVEKKDLW